MISLETYVELNKVKPTVHAEKYLEAAENNYTLSKARFSTLFSQAMVAYPKAKIHGEASVIPLTQVLRVVNNGLNLFSGILFGIHALFNWPKSSLPKVACGLAYEFLSLLINAVCVVLSALTLITRSLSTLVNRGYILNDSKLENDHLGATDRSTKADAEADLAAVEYLAFGKP
jgi:hypothetical protein